jgi:hypothetical protein
MLMPMLPGFESFMLFWLTIASVLLVVTGLAKLISLWLRRR